MKLKIYKLKSSKSQTLRRRADEFVGNYPQFIGFSYGIYPVEGIGVFRVPKNGDARNKKPPALRVETKRCTKKSPFRYNRVVQALL